MSQDALHVVEAIFTGHELYFAAPDSFNDPFESRFDLVAEADQSTKEAFIADGLLADDPSQGVDVARAKARGVFEHAPDMLKVVEESIREKLSASARRDPAVLSLSARPDHILMWSHYADSHRGICIGFRVGPESGFFASPAKVIYQPNFPRVSLYEPSHKKRFTSAALTKSDVWSYEEEWRVVAIPAPFATAAGVRTFPPAALSRVILGAEISEENRNRVLQWVNAYPSQIEVLAACVVPTQYTIELMKHAL